MRHNNKELLVEVFPQIPADLRDQYSPDRKDKFFADWSSRRAGELKVNGMPSPDSNVDEPWRVTSRETRFVPMQARTGDYALFFRKAAVEITFEGDRYLVVPQAAILALVRDDLDDL